MEPLNSVARVSADGCELWYGAQSLSSDQAKVAALLVIAPDKAKINQLFAGGSFGRRACLSAGHVLETVRIAKALGDGQPVAGTTPSLSACHRACNAAVTVAG